MAKRLNYTIGVNADTSQLQAQLNATFKALNKVGTQTALTSELKQASQAALELSSHLNNSFNKETGSFDLINFNKSLAQSGKTLESYANDLSNIGPQGEQAFLKVAMAIDSAQLPLRRTSKLFDELWTTMKNTMRWQLTSSALHVLVGTLQTAYGYAKDLNRSLNEIRIVTSKSAEDMTAFAEQANRAAKALSTTTVDYTDASLIYYQQGLNDKEVADRTDTTIKMANVAGTTAEEASQQLTAIWNNFYDGSKSLEYYADVMVKLGAATASSSDEISEGIEKFAAVANTVGLSYDYAASALATVTAQTRESASVVGTAFRTLFSRIQGLQQGETLDDGTTLNKYSTALAKVGVNIKDTDGQLKDMDVILSELGDKWETLAQDQKIALAETVAGVRQWTQLIALMDHWDFFEENLAIAQGSEGALEAQANIYAESWEAARKRIKAAGEDIYDSLINPDFFIGVDNVFTPILTGVADVIDGLGGMSGVLSGVVLLVNKIYGGKIAQGMRDFVISIGLANGKEQEKLRLLQQQAVELTNNLSITYSASDAQSMYLQIMKDEVMVQGAINEQYDKLDEQQKRAVNNEKYMLDLVNQERKAIVDRISQLQTSLQDKKIQMSVSLNEEDWQNKLRSAIRKYNVANKNNKINLGIDIKTSDIDTVFSQILDKMDKLGAKSATLNLVGNQFAKLNKNSENYRQNLEELLNTYGDKVGFVFSGSGDKIDEFEAHLRKLGQQGVETGQEMRALASLLKVMGADPQTIREYISEVQRLNQELQRGEITQEEFDAQTERMMGKLQGANKVQKDWADNLVATGTMLSQVTMGLNAVTSLIDIFTTELGEGETALDRLLKILTNFGMLLPVIGSLTKKETIHNAKLGLSYIFTGASAETAKAGIENVGTAINTAIPILGLIILAIGAVVKIIDAVTVSAEEAREKMQEATDAYEEQKSQLESLNSELETTKDKIDELNNKDSLTIVEGEELKKLKQQEASLNRQIMLQERLLKAKQKTQAITIEENFKKSADDLAKGPKVRDLWLGSIQVENDKDFEEATRGLGKETDLYKDYLNQYEEWKKEVQEKNEEYVAENSDTFQQLEDQYQSYIDAINSGVIKYNPSKVKELQEGLLKNRKLLYPDENEYFEVYIKPVLEEDSVEEVSSEIYQKLAKGADPEEVKGLISDPIKQALLNSGITVDEFLNRLQGRINQTKEQLKTMLPEGTDLSSLTAEDWNILMSVNLQGEGIKDLDSLMAFLDSYKQEHNVEVEVSASGIGEILRAYQDDEELSEEQIALLDAVETKYAELSELRNKGGHEYLELLRQIQEQEEQNSLTELENTRQQLFEKAAALQQEITNLQAKQEDSKNQRKYQIQIDAKVDEFNETMSELMKTKYEIDVQVNADLASDVDQAFGLANEFEKISGYLSDSLEISFDKAQEIIDAGYGELLIGARETANHTIEINETTRDAFINNKREELNADREAKIKQLQNERSLLVAKQDAVQKGIAALKEGLASTSIVTKAEALLQASKYKAQADAAKVTAEKESDAADEKNDEIATDAERLVSALGLMNETNAENAQQAYSDAAVASTQSAQIQINALNKIQEAAVAMSNAIAAAATGNATYNPVSGGIGGTVNVGATGSKEGENTYSTTQASFTSPNLSINDIMAATGGDSATLDAALESALNQLEAQNTSISNQIGSIDAGIAALQSTDLSLGNIGSGGSSSGGSGGGGGSSNRTYDKEELKTLEDVEDRYHNINRQIERQSDLLDDLSNSTDRAWGTEALEGYAAEIAALEEQQENYNQKLLEAQDYLKSDGDLVKQYFADANIAANGEITNYEELLKENLNLYNAEVERYNQAVAGKELSEEEYNKYKAQLDEAQQLFEARQHALEQYEETLDVVRDTLDNIQDTARSLADKKLEEIKFKIQIVLDVKSMKDVVRDLRKSISEIFGDILTQNFAGYSNIESPLGLDAEAAQKEIELLGSYQEEWNSLKALYESTEDEADRKAIMEEMQSLQSNIAESAKAFIEWANSIEDIVPNAIDAAAERFSEFTNQLEHNTSVLDTIKELYALQGITYKTTEGFNRLQQNTQERMNASVATAQLQKTRADEAAKRLAEAQAKLDSLNGDESDPRYDTYKKARDAYLQEFNEAQEAYLSSAQKAMELAQEMYLQQIDKAAYEFGKAAANGTSLDLLQDKYDHYIEENERYFDKVNEAYQTSSWYNKLQADIDKTTNSAHKERLKVLQKEIDQRRENNKLSQYDLDILNAKYEVMQAQMALEDAQNAKNKIQLTRDSQGNWNYQYTADQDQIAEAQQNLLDAENEWYNTAKQQVTDVTGEITSTWQECQDKVKEIYSDMTLTDEERSAKAQEIYRYYSEKIKSLEEEKQIAIADMTEAGATNLLHNAAINGDAISGLISEDIQNVIENYQGGINGLLQLNGEQLKRIFGENTKFVDLFENTYATDLGKMTINAQNFEKALQEYLGKAEGNFKAYQGKVQETAKNTGTTLDELAKDTDVVSKSTEGLRRQGQETTIALWDMVSAAQTLAFQQIELAASVWDSVNAYRSLTEEIARYARATSGLANGYDPNVDYEALIMDGLANGWLTYGSDQYRELFKQREAKIDDLGLTEDYYGTRGAAADERYRNATAVGQFTDEGTYREILDKLGVTDLGTTENGPVDKHDRPNEGIYAMNESPLVNGSGIKDKEELYNNKELYELYKKQNSDYLNELIAKSSLLAITPEILNSIEKALDSNAFASIALIGEKLDSLVTNGVEVSNPIEQTVHIESVEFPNVTSRTEIEEAFVSLTNDAAQWARRRD